MNSIKYDGKDIYPTKVVCIGLNYADHIKEFDHGVSEDVVIFMKPNSAVSNDVCSSDEDVIHYEAEISFMIDAGQIRAVGFGLDLTKRELQYRLMEKGWPWERAKSFDGAAVFSEFVPFEGDISALRMEFYINDVLVQFGGYDLMLNKPEQMLKEVISFLTIEDGDLLMTGTPKGVGPVKAGDHYHGKIFENARLIVEGFWVVK
jgi:2-keto-4-pentenoate hydratase/2-oxohepta-3-ene-1,7-dioic acid hydratase in catechol pathway